MALEEETNQIGIAALELLEVATEACAICRKAMRVRLRLSASEPISRWQAIWTQMTRADRELRSSSRCRINAAGGKPCITPAKGD